MEQTYVMVKPDGVERGLIGEIVAKIEKKGIKLVAGKLIQIDRKLAEQHYAEHIGKPFFEDLIGFITSGPVFAMVLEGDDVIKIARRMMGKTNPLEADAGTIRAEYAVHTNRNVIHGSDSPESAKREIQLFFEPHEILSYEKAVDIWV
ncbi:nucleoside-diphosphate kinase [Listeria welshimeri]|uniref:Nucleoside diphosphate kinase n=2 Tax=Listeria welshimeri TaxID=1643 RepID=NDK_LISW6|nr:nucleoside-diphosphate kinase [Listeria welshimeri]A0AK41.1 RecName: Full=Nucleoside diphosphate kinase; Short=NDK; Short=NDP kinase; AltName: Full=Nucleoside-2-P kinase [Listeria welshimeri serovar 6b str. SLCC5334]MBC1243844.1 nucleoside-diphosphate kinase [Listeria welshimeri]MBC1249201.1 nucleoside-diphosphate kinase [Listeria welshimeri]MBC1252306.1 nucleoside-diphosphate kinase [Listeria welshimeri]MBC1282987.1 nucleoside-diphosphate kinase [Listeria welshimeri]MBC1319293.1 nucleosid